MKKLLVILLCVSLLFCTTFACFANNDDNASYENPAKKLQLSENDKMIFGVCGGLGEYFNIEPKLIRIGFVIFSLCGGSGILVYIICAIIM